MAQGFSYFTRFLREDNNFQDPFTNNLSPSNPQYPYSSTFLALFEAFGAAFWTTVLSFLGFSLRVKAATDYYVDPSGGNDANPGTLVSPWRTFAHAMAVLVTLDFFGQTVTLHLVNNATEQLAIAPWTGGGAFVVDLGGKSITVTTGSAISISGLLSGLCTIKNGTVAGTGSSQASGIYHAGGGQVQLGDTTGATTLTVGACTFCGLVATGLGGGQPSMNIVGPINFSGAAVGQLALMFAAASAVFTTGFLNGNNLIQATGNLANASITAFANFALFSFQGSLAFHKNAHTVPATDTSIAAPASMGTFPGWI